jgi:hypothetical protein
MVSFAKMVEPQEAEAILAYVVHQAILAERAPQGAGFPGGRCVIPSTGGAAPAATAAGAPAAPHQ